ncbi:MAG: cyclodeaminase/cyclohydrolase family protein [Termitinemataceae bacterium]|nr:MAG: cyclodeaminase/cyclohydrolase family protein [Termitinemataceae bacterium]
MQFKDYTIELYMNALSSTNPTPGGGTSSALTAAMGLSFIAMVANISLTKNCFLPHKNELQTIADKALALRKDFFEFMDSDSKAYNNLIKTVNQKGSHKESEFKQLKQEKLLACIKEPFFMLKKIEEGLHLAETLSKNFYKPTASDLGIAARNLDNSAFGVYLTIHINKNHIISNEFISNIIHESDIILKNISELNSCVSKRITAIIGSGFVNEKD